MIIALNVTYCNWWFHLKILVPNSCHYVLWINWSFIIESARIWESKKIGNYNLSNQSTTRDGLRDQWSQCSMFLLYYNLFRGEPKLLEPIICCTLTYLVGFRNIILNQELTVTFVLFLKMTSRMSMI